ncbi:hypothetical protein CK203_086654 [Vitis vinifera]|uniref:Uncharacterized protein n=1 Tax=Vitis vinifera TaxID=29760 RepID=A0A438E604_VITVI|nr:hypothetical protein CK203_086654 [Vitis vinifera]
MTNHSWILVGSLLFWGFFTGNILIREDMSQKRSFWWDMPFMKLILCPMSHPRLEAVIAYIGGVLFLIFAVVTLIEICIKSGTKSQTSPTDLIPVLDSHVIENLPSI